MDPDSIGVRLRKGEQEADLVLYRGGWADVDYWTGEVADDAQSEVEGDYDDPLSVEDFGDVIGRLAAPFG